MGQAEHAEVAPVQGEHGLNPFPVRQMQQRGVGNPYPQCLILGQNGGDGGEIRLAQRKKLKGAAMKRGQPSNERTTELYGQRNDNVSVGAVERIGI